MHTLYYITTIVEYSLDVFRIDGAREMGIAVMFAFTRCRTYTLKKKGILKIPEIQNSARYRKPNELLRNFKNKIQL